MPRIPAPDYTGRDYDSGLVRAERLIQSIFPNWTDFNKSNFGNTLVRAFAFILDIVSFVTDFWARESLPLHARLRRSVQSHALWIGYSMAGRKAALATETFTLVGGAHTQDVTIPAGTLIRVASDINFIEFQLLADTTITAGNTSVDGVVEHSENAQDLDSSTGRANQTYRLGQSPYIDGTISVLADDGTYTIVDNFLSSGEADKHFTIEVDDDERVILRFGDGRTGKIPVGQITATYKVGGGPEGNVDASTITELQETILDALGVSIEVSATNSLAAQGGEDPETLEKAQQEAPASLRVLNRSITREDFEITARGVDGIIDCVALTADETGLIREGELVGYCVAKGDETSTGKFKPAAPSTVLLDAVEDAWENTRPGPFYLRRRALGDVALIFKTVNIVATVYLGEDADKTIPGSGLPTNIGNDVFNGLDDFFAITDAEGVLQTGITFGFKIKDANGGAIGTLAWSDIFNVIRDTTGIRKMNFDSLTLNGSTEDVALKFWEIPILGTVQIIEAETSDQLYPAV